MLTITKLAALPLFSFLALSPAPSRADGDVPNRRQRAEKVTTAPEGASRDITHGNVRVVLMSISQTTVFPNAGDTDKPAPKGRTNDGVPCFTVTVLVEALRDKPFKKTSSLSVKLLSAGESISLENSRGEHKQDFDYAAYKEFLDFTKPKVSNVKRAFIQRYVDFGAVADLEPLDLVIKAGFDEDIQTFEFKSVSLK